MAFEHPLLLLLLPLALLPFLGRLRRAEEKLSLALPGEVRRQPPSLRVRVLWVPASLAALATAASIVAAAGPHTRVREAADRRQARPTGGRRATSPSP
jgi:hypothetical protein